MITYPNAKINIGLNIIKKRNDGYHDISSVFYPVNQLFDILEISPSNIFSFTNSGIPIDTDKNICIKAYELLKADFAIPPVRIHLHKKIPIGAGLGGGSADGAFTLTSLNQIFQLKLSNNELEKYALLLGADCPFFIDNKPKYVNGIGERMLLIDLDLSNFDIRFVFTDLFVSTAQAYTNITPQMPNYDLLAIINDPIENWQRNVKNDFEMSIFITYPKLRAIKEKLYADGALYASMTGSGSVIYGIFNK